MLLTRLAPFKREMRKIFQHCKEKMKATKLNLSLTYLTPRNNQQLNNKIILGTGPGLSQW